MAGAVDGLSVIVPAYDEETGIGRVLDQLSVVLAGMARPSEIVVVDDGSCDGTAAVAAAHANGAGSVTMLQHRANRGYGASIKTGIRHAAYPLLCITDADGTYPNESIPDLIACLETRRSDMVVGARTGANVAIPWVRRPAKWLIGRLADFVTGEAIPDLNSGLRVFRREAALDFLDILPDGFSLTTTITLGMLTNSYLVEYLPIDYHPRVGRSKIRPVRDTLNFVQLILRIALYFAPLKIFLSLSALLLAAAALWGLFSTLVLGRLADVSTLVIGMTAVQVAAIGLLAELINHRVPAHARRLRDDARREDEG